MMIKEVFDDVCIMINELFDDVCMMIKMMFNDICLMLKFKGCGGKKILEHSAKIGELGSWITYL